MSGIRFAQPAEGYFVQRTLRRHARVLHLWALGVGAVIAGDFFGWNFGLRDGGFGGMLLALLIMTVLFAGLCCSIAEMSPALAPYRRRVFLRAHRNGSVGRLHHGPGRKHGVHSDARGNRRRHRRISWFHLRNITRVDAGLVAGLLRGVCRLQYRGRRVVVPCFAYRHVLRACRAAGVLRGCGISFRIWNAGRSRARVGFRMAGPVCCRPCHSRYGCISASSSFRWPPRNRTIPSATCRKACCWA